MMSEDHGRCRLRSLIHHSSIITHHSAHAWDLPSRKVTGTATTPARAGPRRSATGPGVRGGAGAGVGGKVNGPLRFEFASDFDAGCAVQQQILDEVERHGFNPNSLFATRLALGEAPATAIH